MDMKFHHPTDHKTTPATGSRERSNDALNAFIAAKAEIDELLRRLQALSDDRFNTHPDDINWGEVGTFAELRCPAARDHRQRFPRR